jgi:hypothetical protein
VSEGERARKRGGLDMECLEFRFSQLLILLNNFLKKYHEIFLKKSNNKYEFTFYHLSIILLHVYLMENTYDNFLLHIIHMRLSIP